MAQPKITYTDKVQGQANPAPAEEKYTFGDANEVKTVVNAHADQIDLNEADIATNQTNITNEATARAAADTTLQSNIDAEATTRAAADTTLQANIDNEEAARITADSNLQSQVTNNATSITNLENNKVTGPLSATDNFVVVFDGATGKLIKVPNASINFNDQRLINADGLDVDNGGSSNGISLVHSGSGNAIEINNSGSGEAIDVVSGTVRIQDLTADRYLYLDANGRLTVKTTAEILTEIGALPLAGGTMTGAILGDQSARLYRPVGSDITANTDTDVMQNNTFFDVDSSGGAVTITLSALTTSAEGNAEWDLFVTDATNTITISADTGVTAIASGDVSLAAGESMTVGAVGDGFQIKLKADNTYRVIGGTFTKI